MKLLAVVVYCWLYSSLVLCRRVEPISEEKFDEGLRECDEEHYKTLLKYAIPAASSNKNIVQTSHGISEDCMRTARVFMRSYRRPSDVERMALILSDSIEQATKHKMTLTLTKAVDEVCENLSKKLKEIFPDLEELKKDMDVPKPEPNYILERPTSQRVREWAQKLAIKFDDKGVLKFEIIWQQLEIKSLLYDPKYQELIGIAKAIDRLVYKYPTKQTVDDVYTTAFNKYVDELVAQPSKQKVDEVKIRTITAEFLKQADLAFLANESLKEEYSKLKKDATI